MDENDKLRKDNANKNSKNDDDNNHKLSLDAQLRENDSHLNVLHKEADDLRAAYDRSQKYKNDLSEQIEATNKHIDTLTGQNNRLSQELTDITERDAQIRNILDRRNKVKDLYSQNDDDMRKSLSYISDVRSRSPCRRKKL